MQSVADYEAWKAKQQQARVKASAFVIGQSDKNPDELAGDLQLATDFAAATGNPKPPAPMVSEYRSVFQAAIEKTRAETILSSSPRLTDWLRDPENATLAKDDLDTLSWWESAALVPRRLAAGAGPRLASGVYNAIGVASALPGENAFSDFFLDEAARQAELVDVIGGPTGGWFSQQVAGAAEGVGLSIPGLALSALSGGTATPGLATALIAPGAVAVGGQSARAGLDAGLSPERALLYGSTDAAAEALFERIPVGRFLGDIAEGAGFGKILVNQLAREIPTETATTLFQNFNEWVTLNPDKTVSEFISEQPEAIRDTVAQTFLATLGMSGLGAGVSRLARLSEEQARAQDAEARVALFQELSGQAVASKLRARMPERFRDFVERATQNGPVESVYVPASEFASYFQTAGIDPYALVDELDGVTRDDLDAALAGGGDLKIPTATYAAKIAGSDHDAFLMENMRFDPLDMTAREAAEFNARADEIMQEMWAEAEDIRQDDERWRAVEEKIHDEVVSRLRMAGLSTERAMAEVQPIVAFYRTRAARMGLTTEEYLERHPLPGIQGAIPQGMQFKNVDELNRTLAEARRYRAPARDTRQSLLEFVADYGGVNDPGGELKARDAAVIKRPGKKTLRLARDMGPEGQASMFGSAGGKRFGVDDVAQAAIEAGFMADNPVVIAYKASLEDGTQAPDITRAFWDAVDAELRGDRQASDQDAAPVDTAYLDEIEGYLNRLGLDLNNSDDEIRQAIERDQAAPDRMYAQDGQIATESAAFKAWFGDSKVVDADGKPLVVYHGTASDFGQFSKSADAKHIDLPGFFFTPDAAIADGFAESASRRPFRDDAGYIAGFEGATVVPVYLSIQNPAEINLPDRETGRMSRASDVRAMLEQAQADGHDGAVIRGWSDGSGDVQYVAFSPTQIKSVFNRGTFDPADPRILFQSAFHGSPHLFDKFSLSAIGAGEGAQAFGWGLYFAGRKEIAEYYRDTLAGKGPEISIDGKPTSRIELIDQISAELSSRGLEARNANYAASWIASKVRQSGAQWRKNAIVFGDDPEAQAKKIAVEYMKGKKVKLNTGRLYEVEIPDDAELLNWDAPLKDQPPAVLEKLRPLMDRFTPADDALLAELGVDVSSPATGNDPVMEMTGAQFYQDLADRSGALDWPVGADAAQRRSFVGNAHRRASEALRAAGIPGHRFLDGGSRDSGGGSFNYVIYDDSRVQVSRFEQGPRGQITFNLDGSSMIRLFETANLSTVQHEMGHLFLTMMQRDVATGDQAAVAEYEVIKSWWRESAAAVAADGNRAMPDAKLTAEDVQRAIDTGTTGDMMKDAAVDVGMQEQWARGYEAYLMEGKAPSVELRGVFEKFRSWLISVYRNLVGLNVNISPEIRGVFDRMLATDEEIAKAKQASGENRPIFTTAEQMGLTQEEFDRLMKLRTQAEDEATARLQREIMEPIRREAEKEYREEKAKVTEDVTRRLRRMPVYRAIQEMRFGKTFEGDETPGVKLDRDVIEAQYGAGYLPFLPGATKDGKGHKNAVFTNEGGIHPDVAAAMYGFQTGRELLDMMSNAPALDVAIKAEVEAEMYQKHGDPLNDGEIERKALEALHNDKRGEWLAAEMKAVAEVAGVEVGLTVKEARATAAMTLGRMKVRDARMAMRFLAAERKAGEEAQRIARELGRESVWMQNARRRIAVKARAALRDDGTVDAVAGQIDRANASTGNYNETVQKLIDAKRRQVMNHALFMESVKQREATDKIVDRMAKLNRTDKKLSKSITVDHVKAARAIAAKFGLARPDTEFDFNAWLEQLAFEDPIRAGALQEAIAAWGEDAKDYRDLTVSELGAVVDGIDNVLATGKRFSGIETAGKRIERDQVVAELVAVLDERGYPENEAMSGLKSIMSGAKSLTSSTRAMLRVVETWARTMDNGEQGPFTNYIVRPVMDALGEYFDNRNRQMKELLAIVDGAKKMTGQAIPAPELRTAGAQPFTFENKAKLIHAILHTGNESNKAKLLIGWGFSDGFVNPKQAMTAAGKPRVKRDGTPILTKGELDTSRWDAFLDRMIREGTITPADIDLVNSIWAVFEKTKRPAQATHKKLKGFYFKEIENTPYETAAGVLRGGYVPAIIDKDASLDAGRQDDMRALDQSATSMFPTTGAGFTKSRVENYREPLELNLMLLPSHLDDVLRFTYLEPAIQQTASLVRGRDLRDPMQRFDANVVGDTIMPWLQRTASRSLNVANASPAKRRWGRAMDRLRGRIGVSIMFMNVINTAQQVTGPIVAMSEVSPRLLGNALVRMVSGDAANMRAAISEASPYMAERLRLVSNDTQVELRELLTDRTVFSEIDTFTQKHGYILQSAFQNMLDPIVWHGAYDQAISRGMSHDAAVFEADSAVRRTMPDSAPENVTAFAQGTVTWRMITMFTSFFISQANLLGGRMDVIRRQMGWNGAPQMFWAYLTIFALPAIVAQAIADGASGAGPEDEDEDGMTDELLAWFGITQLRYGAAMVPLFGQAGLKTINAFNDNPVDDRLSVSPVVSAIETATRMPGSVYGAVAEDGSARRAVVDGLQAIGLITGIPTGQLGRTVGYGVGVSEDRFSPTGPVDVVQGVISGRDGTER